MMKTLWLTIFCVLGILGVSAPVFSGAAGIAADDTAGRTGYNGWLVVAFSGEENGYLEPCGCEKTMIGGIARRDGMFLLLNRGNQTILPLSLGDLSGHVKRQDEIKTETLVQALGDMQYELHNIGEKDLEMGPEVLSYFFLSSPVKLLSSNVVLSDVPGLTIHPYVVRTVKAGDGEVKVGVLGILSPNVLETVLRGVEITPPSEAIAPLLKEMGDVDLLILLSHADLAESVKLAESFPEFQLVVSGHRETEPTVVNVGNTVVAACGNRGMNVGLFYYRPDGAETRLEMVELGERYQESSRMLDLLDSYQQRLRDEDLLGRVEKYPYDGGAAYAGNVICGACHQETFLHWKTTGHALAHETLEMVAHDYDPECVACHVTGLYYESGFTSQEQTPGLKGVGCESCHGPGSMHVAAAEKGIKGDGYGKVEPRDCETCHDIEHSSQFRYKDYWTRIVHPEERPKG